MTLITLSYHVVQRVTARWAGTTNAEVLDVRVNAAVSPKYTVKLTLKQRRRMVKYRGIAVTVSRAV